MNQQISQKRIITVLFPTQQLIAEENSIQSYEVGKKSVTIINGTITTINEKYGVFPSNYERSIAGSKIVFKDDEQTFLKNLSGGKENYMVYRNFYNYENLLFFISYSYSIPKLWKKTAQIMWKKTYYMIA